jgi:molybdopterin molybdotransferase
MSFISYEESLNILNLLHVGSLRFENIFLSDSLGRVLYEDVVADEASPVFETAAMDGYAIIGEDQALTRLEILGDNPAGSDETRVVTSGYCIKTFTGSMIPKGADTLIQIENVTVDGNEIIINQTVSVGASVRPVGESYNKGDVLIKKGTKLSFAEIGVLAGLNKVMIKVVVAPKVAILATGSEILDLAETALTHSQIRSSNNYTIEALVKLSGAQTLQLGVVKDDKLSIMESFENALAIADIVISTGGVSVGDYDFVKEIVPSLGAEVVFKGVNIKPGQHIMLAQRENKFILALPGFAYSSTVTAILYALPLINRFLGKTADLSVMEAKLTEKFYKKSRKTEFSACNLTLEDGGYKVDFRDKKSGTSAILTNLLNNSALMISGEEDGNLEEGMLVRVIPLNLL